MRASFRHSWHTAATLRSPRLHSALMESGEAREYGQMNMGLMCCGSETGWRTVCLPLSPSPSLAVISVSHAVSPILPLSLPDAPPLILPSMQGTPTTSLA
ncbi:Inositol 1,4,5-trisphosphate receptor type 2 [Clarias magur]|uniref:Inositol 1,4,5-trisphosphate receptor type 2 n=1 Tax=Clarias magur TaxID=1594786 RepID=A0A8J4UMX3_CLAMG|nr:Inositol 1,4,5-trisphosphate receptor type 2 [Clarias magur]